jgi:hypothetical protein
LICGLSSGLRQQPGKGGVFARVVILVGVVAQVVDDVEHQLVAGFVAGMKAIDLLFEHREQPAEGGVFVVPGLEQVGHGVVPVQPIGSSSISPDAVFEIGM